MVIQLPNYYHSNSIYNSKIKEQDINDNVKKFILKHKVDVYSLVLDGSQLLCSYMSVSPRDKFSPTIG